MMSSRFGGNRLAAMAAMAVACALGPAAAMAVPSKEGPNNRRRVTVGGATRHPRMINVSPAYQRRTPRTIEDHDAYDAAQAKRDRKNAKRLADIARREAALA